MEKKRRLSSLKKKIIVFVILCWGVPIAVFFAYTTSSYRKGIIEKTEGRRKQYHMYYTGEDWGYAANYDLCINDTRFGIEGTADIIMQYVKDCTAQEK